MTERKKNGNYIKRLRDLNAWTQEDLALKSGVSVSTIQRAERGENISQDVIICLADVFGVSVQDIKGMDDQPYRGRLREGAESYAKALASDILR